MSDKFPDRSESTGWSEYMRDQRLILSELKRFNSWLNEIDKRLNTIDTKLAVQEVKASMWGAIAGVATIVVVLFVKYLLTGTLK